MVGATAGLLTVVTLLLALLWLAEKRREAEREAGRIVHRLSEAAITAATPDAMAALLAAELPKATRADAASLYVLNRRTRTLERHMAQGGEPMSVPLDGSADGLVNAAVLCFQNRAVVPIPRIEGSPLMKGAKVEGARAALFAPLVSQGEALGVLEATTSRSKFGPSDAEALEHIANQAAMALKLQEQRLMREQVFHSEKLAATGQLISGVAGDLHAPLERITRLADDLAAFGSPGSASAKADLNALAAEAKHASEIVARLASFAGPQQALPRGIDVHELLRGLARFREPEWKVLALKADVRVPQSGAVVLGTRGQLEQVFLNLLVYAEREAGKAPSRSLSIESAAIGQRVHVGIRFVTEGPDPLADRSSAHDPLQHDPMDAQSGGLSVCLAIARAHGGEIRFRAESMTGAFEVDLPLVESTPEPAQPSLEVREKSKRPLTLMLVETDAQAQKELLELAGGRGHRMVPVAAAEAAEVASQFPFDAVLWTVRPGGPSWSTAHDRLLACMSSFVLLSDGYDAVFARSLEESGGFLLARPIQEEEFDRVLAAVASR